MIISDNPMTQSINGLGKLSPGTYRAQVLTVAAAGITVLTNRGAHHDDWEQQPDLAVFEDRSHVQVLVVPHGVVVTRPSGGYQAVLCEYGRVVDKLTDVLPDLTKLGATLTALGQHPGSTRIKEIHDEHGNQLLYSAVPTVASSSSTSVASDRPDHEGTSTIFAAATRPRGDDS